MTGTERRSVIAGVGGSFVGIGGRKTRTRGKCRWVIKDVVFRAVAVSIASTCCAWFGTKIKIGDYEVQEKLNRRRAQTRQARSSRYRACLGPKRISFFALTSFSL